MNIENKRVIKLISPSGKLFCLELGGKELELKDLISSLCRISANNLKGIKDKYGNYYTFSSAISNPSINSDLSDYFYLICGTNTRTPYVQTAENFKKLNCFTEVDNSNKKHEEKHSSINNSSSPANILNRTPDFIQSSQNSFYKENIPPSQDLLKRSIKAFPLAHSQNIEMSNKLPINQLQILSQADDGLSKKSSIDGLNVKETQYIQTAKLLIKEKLLEEKALPVLKQLFLEENSDIISLFRLFHQKILDQQTLANGVDKILVLVSSYHNGPSSHTKQKIDMKSLLESVENQFDDPNDIILLKRLMNFENEFLMGALDLYESEKDYENLLDSLRRIVQKYKGKNILSSARNNNVNSQQNISSAENQEKLKSSKTKVIPIEVKRLTDNNSDKKKSKETTSSNTASTQNSNNNTSPQEKSKPAKAFTKEMERNIINQLHTVQQTLFNYALTSRSGELSLFLQLYDLINNEDAIIKLIKEYCNKLLNDTVLKNFNEKQIEKYNVLVKSKDKDILKIFSEFDIHQSLDLFQKDLTVFILSLDHEEQKNQSSSSDSDKEENESGSEKENEGKFPNLGKILNHMQLTEIEKKEILSKVRAGDQELLNIFEEYQRTNSLIALWYSLSSLMKKKSIPQQMLKIKTEANIKEAKKSSMMSSILFSFETVLSTLENDKRISSSECSILLKRYTVGDEMLNSFWEVYQNNLNMEELIESLKMYLTSKYKKRVSDEATNSALKTPISLSKNKKDLIDFLKRTEKKSHDKEDIKRKQNNVISILLREKYIHIDTFDFIKSKIENEDEFVTSAFELYAVTKDHRDFCETLGIITEIYYNSKSSNENTMTRGSKKSVTFDIFINESSYNENEREVLMKKYSENDEMLMSALEIYEKNFDEEELNDTLRILIKKYLRKK